MNVSDGPRQATFVRLPGDVRRPFQVFLNGVEQREGVDFVVRDGTLVFERELATEAIGVGRWTSMVLGIQGRTGRTTPSTSCTSATAGPPSPRSCGSSSPPPERRRPQRKRNVAGTSP